MELKIKTEPCAIVAAVFLGIRALEKSTTSVAQPIAITAIVCICIMTTTASYAIAKSIFSRPTAPPQRFNPA